jgi:hypothetical protein
VPIPDEERFEAYLKQFRPLVPEPLPTSGSRHRARGRFVLWAGAAAGVAILVGATALHIHTKRVRVAETTSSPATTDPFADRQPLTMRSANALIVKAPSFKALADGMAFRSQTIPVPKGKLSAVAVLGKEKIKL